MDIAAAVRCVRTACQQTMGGAADCVALEATCHCMIERTDLANAMVTPDGSSSAKSRRRWRQRPSATRPGTVLASGRGSKRVIVVGGGLAGLCAAYELAALGHDVTVLEAQERPGGRVHTLRAPFSDDLYAEAGASRIPTSHDLTVGCRTPLQIAARSV